MIPCRNLILFVEDDALLHVGIEQVMAGVGLSVEGVLSADEAAQVLAARGEEICALVTDIHLGCALDGWALARCARKAIPDLAVIYATSVSAGDFVTERVPGARLITKPYALEHVAQVARAMLTPS